MIGEECTPATRMRSYHSGCSATVVPNATWWTVPAPWRPRRAGALEAAPVGSGIDDVAAAAALAAQLVRALAGRRRAEERLEQRAGGVGVEAVGAHGVEAPQREVGGDLRVLRGQRLVAGGVERGVRGRGLPVGVGG